MTHPDIQSIDMIVSQNTYEALNEKELKMIQQHFADQQEYNDYREFLLLSKEAMTTEHVPEVDPGIELRVIEHMKLAGNTQNSAPKESNILAGLLSLFSIQALGYKTSFAMAIAIIAMVNLNHQEEIIPFEYNHEHHLISDSSIGVFQDSNYLRTDSSLIKASL